MVGLKNDFEYSIQIGRSLFLSRSSDYLCNKFGKLTEKEFTDLVIEWISGCMDNTPESFRDCISLR